MRIYILRKCATLFNELIRYHNLILTQSVKVADGMSLVFRKMNSCPVMPKDESEYQK